MGKTKKPAGWEGEKDRGTYKKLKMKYYLGITEPFRKERKEGGLRPKKLRRKK